MKKVISMLALIFVLAGLTGCGNVDTATLPSSMEGEATILFIVFDNSGSMEEDVTNAKGKAESKCDIADRALIAVGQRFDSYLAAKPNRTLGVGIVEVSGRPSFSSFKVLNSGVANHFKEWTKTRSNPSGGTPLGNGLKLASENMDGIANSNNKHIVVLTDGLSNGGPSPEEVLPKIKERFSKQGIDLGVHVVAFDINDQLFASLKKLGATVLGASNEVELNSQFDFILREKIMLERPE